MLYSILSNVESKCPQPRARAQIRGALPLTKKFCSLTGLKPGFNPGVQHDRVAQAQPEKAWHIPERNLVSIKKESLSFIREFLYMNPPCYPNDKTCVYLKRTPLCSRSS